MPWLGGGGVTHELARYPAEGDFDWRLSVAEVLQDGPFSRLDGVDRVIVLCSPGRMVLNVPEPMELQRFSPYAFDGGSDVSCTVPEGPTLDFNVMTRRGAYAADVATVAGATAEVDVPSDGLAFVLCMDGAVTCGVGLRAYDLVRLDGSTRLDATNGTAAVVALRSTTGP